MIFCGMSSVDKNGPCDTNRAIWIRPEEPKHFVRSITKIFGNDIIKCQD